MTLALHCTAVHMQHAYAVHVAYVAHAVRVYVFTLHGVDAVVRGVYVAHAAHDVNVGYDVHDVYTPCVVHAACICCS